jgi:hypothetical protein
VFPQPDYSPAILSEALRDEPVSLSIALQLRLPIASITTGRMAVLRASVPEASVNKHGNACSRKHDVCTNASSIAYGKKMVLAEP